MHKKTKTKNGDHYKKGPTLIYGVNQKSTFWSWSLGFSDTNGALQFVRGVFLRLPSVKRCREVHIGGQPIRGPSRLFFCFISKSPTVQKINSRGTGRGGRVGEQQTTRLRAGGWKRVPTTDFHLPDVADPHKGEFHLKTRNGYKRRRVVRVVQSLSRPP